MICLPAVSVSLGRPRTEISMGSPSAAGSSAASPPSSAGVWAAAPPSSAGVLSAGAEQAARASTIRSASTSDSTFFMTLR